MTVWPVEGVLAAGWPPTAGARVMSSLRMASTAPNSAQRGSYSASRPSVMACFRGDCYKGSSPVSPTIESCRRSHGGASSGRVGPPSFSPVIPCERVPLRARVICAQFCARFLKSSSVTCQSCFWAVISECPAAAVPEPAALLLALLALAVAPLRVRCG